MNKRLNFKQLLENMIPQHCVLCGANTQASSLCTGCDADLPWVDQARCTQCALPLNQSTQSRCGQCLANTPFFDETQALFDYAFPVDAVLQQFKYHDQLSSATFFADLMMQRWPAPSNIDCVIPMPMHPTRLTERGFNQSLEVARSLCSAWSLALDYHSCKRIKNTPPQATLALKARINNVKNAFACDTSLKGLRVLVIDDVMTTGATLNAVAKTLRKAGAQSVSCWVIARTVPH